MTAKKKVEVKKEVVPRKEGRPTKYKPEYCEMLLTHMASGFSYLSFAGVVSVNYDTLYEWEKVHEEFSEAKKNGLAKNLHHWEQLGYQGMWHGGKDQPSFNSTLWIFNMKNRHKWTDNKEVPIAASTNAPQIIVQLPDNGRSAPEKK